MPPCTSHTLTATAIYLVPVTLSLPLFFTLYQTHSQCYRPSPCTSHTLSDTVFPPCTSYTLTFTALSFCTNYTLTATALHPVPVTLAMLLPFTVYQSYSHCYFPSILYQLHSRCQCHATLYQSHSHSYCHLLCTGNTLTVLHPVPNTLSELPPFTLYQSHSE